MVLLVSRMKTKKIKFSGLISVALVIALQVLAIAHYSPTVKAEGYRSIVFPVLGASKFTNDFQAPRPAPWYTHSATDVMAGKGQALVSPVDGVITYVTYPQPSYGYLVNVMDKEGYTYSLLHMNDDNPGLMMDVAVA